MRSAAQFRGEGLRRLGEHVTSNDLQQYMQYNRWPEGDIDLFVYGLSQVALPASALCLTLCEFVTGSHNGGLCTRTLTGGGAAKDARSVQAAAEDLAAQGRSSARCRLGEDLQYGHHGDDNASPPGGVTMLLAGFL